MNPNISRYLISQYYGSANIRGILETFEAMLDVEISKAAEDLKPQMGIEAEKYWLELLGKRFAFGRPQLKDEADSTVFFALEPAVGFEAGKDTFNSAPFAPSDYDPAEGSTPASESSYKALMEMKASGMRTDGTQDSINEILDNIFNESYVVDHQNMSMELFYPDVELNNNSRLVLQNLHLVPRPAGVKLNVVSHVAVSATTIIKRR